MPILYHFIAENVNDKNGKYSIYLCTFPCITHNCFSFKYFIRIFISIICFLIAIVYFYTFLSHDARRQCVIK